VCQHGFMLKFMTDQESSETKGQGCNHTEWRGLASRKVKE
jgi:hypothetical protein